MANDGPSHSDQPKAYQAPVEGTTFHGDGREQQLQQHLESRRDELSGDPQRVLDAMDEFGRDRYLMNVGDFKGKLVEEVIRRERPKLVLELGAYIGYSAITFARNLPQLHATTSNVAFPGSWSTSPPDCTRIGYISLEMSNEYATVARHAAELAGLGDVIKICVGPSSETIRNLRSILNMPSPLKFDLVFLDHYKPLYLTDIKILESLALIGPGTTLVADNVIKPGNPPYLAYVRASPTQKRAALEQCKSVLSMHPELASVSVDKDGKQRDMANGYQGNEQATEEREGERGDLRLVYESKLMESWDPYTAERDGVEISHIRHVRRPKTPAKKSEN